jgi:hypothetical protein
MRFPPAPCGGFKAVGVLHRRIGAQGVEPRAFARKRHVARIDQASGAQLLRLLVFKPGLGLPPRPAGVIEFCLGLAQHARLPARLRAGVDAVTFLKAADDLGQRLVLAELVAVFLELPQRVRNVAQKFGRQWRQGFGQRM